MEAICSSETFVTAQQITRRHIPEDDTLHNHRCRNLKSYNIKVTLRVGRHRAATLDPYAEGA
jgi:hypothetical protein